MRLINLDHIIERDKLVIDTKQHDCFAVILSNGAARIVPAPHIWGNKDHNKSRQGYPR